MSVKELKSLLKLANEFNVKSLKVGDIEFELFEAPRVSVNTKCVDEYSDDSPPKILQPTARSEMADLLYSVEDDEEPISEREQE